jgi:pilus assembly protein Flp/PilA
MPAPDHTFLPVLPTSREPHDQPKLLGRPARLNRYHWIFYETSSIGRMNQPADGKEEKNKMTALLNAIVKLKIWSDNRGQDLIEYALMAGFVAVAAGALMPGIATSISTIFSSVASTLTDAAATS